MTSDHVAHLQAAINSSPALIDQINVVVAQGQLKQIVPLANPNAGGQYDPDPSKLAMQLPLSKLTTAPPGPKHSHIEALNAGEITFVLGHELQHGLNRAATRQAYTDFASQVRDIAKNDPAPRDYTAPAAALLAQNRRDEAAAEIAGWNAVVSRVKATNPNASLQDIYSAQPGRMADFIDPGKASPTSYVIKPNLSLNPDLSLSATPANVEAMGQNYFDKGAKIKGGLGPLGNSDYVNYYGRSPISFIAQTERAHHPPAPGVNTPQMGLNLSQLRLNEKLLEENGIDLGTNQQPMPYYDLGNQPPTAHLFQHTKTTHQHVSPIAAKALEEELAREPVSSTPSLPTTQRNDADRDMLEKLGKGVQRLDQQSGKGWDDASERLHASALLMAREKGFTAQDDLVLAFNNPTDKYRAGEILYLVRQGPGASPDPAANRAQMNTSDALSKSVEERYKQIDALGITQQQAQANQVAQQQAIGGSDDPNRTGPTMRM